MTNVSPQIGQRIRFQRDHASVNRNLLLNSPLHVFQAHRTNLALCLCDDVRGTKALYQRSIYLVNTKGGDHAFVYQPIYIRARPRDSDRGLSADRKRHYVRRIIAFMRPPHLERAQTQSVDDLRSTRNQRKQP